MSSSPAPFPYADARESEVISDEQADFFCGNGLLVIRNVIEPAELDALRAETAALIERAERERPDDPYLEDFSYRKHELTGNRVPSRIEYVIDKSSACKGLLGHPFVLRTVEKLQGKDFIPTWDSMVFKYEGQGAAIEWHRDAGTDCVDVKPIFNVDFYLDPSDLTNCVWGIPGSNRWDDAEALAEIRRRNSGGFDTEEAVPILMQPGDVLLHNILTLHGSPPVESKLRRVIYYEFRPIETELALGPHTPVYVPAKQAVLEACLEHR
ncbi:MAG TPA: phytanoyl-CoA dioxygenase family protein, partial [Polyangiaceae bacterium]